MNVGASLVIPLCCLLLIITPVKSTNCYNCDSQKTAACGDSFNGADLQTIDCDGECFWAIYDPPATGKKTVRTCDEEGKCQRKYIVKCETCSTDLCNVGISARSPTPLVLLLTATFWFIYK